MDAADIQWLRSPPGLEATAEAASLVEEHGEIGALRRLAERHGSGHARAAVALLAGRAAAAGKFAGAETLFCDREAAEQTGSEIVAAHTAARFAGYQHVADLGCGMGGDTLALARHARVLAIDRDPARRAMLAANVEAHGLADRVTVLDAEIEGWAPPDGSPVDAVWCDPSRRDSGGRRLAPESWSPPLAAALDAAARVPAAGLKLAPGIDLTLLPQDGEIEFVSLRRQLVAAVLWLGGLCGAPRRATVLPAGASMSGEPDRGSTPCAEPGTYLYDPDPTVGRAALIDVLAGQIGAWKLEERVAYLSSDTRVSTPFARRFRVHAWLPFSERRLYEQLSAMGARRVEVMRRASPVDTNALERRLNEALGGGDTVLTVALTHAGERHVALVCERERD